MLLSYGLRYEAQTLVDDQNNFSPRATLTWSPFKSGRTNIPRRRRLVQRLARQQRLRTDAAGGRLPAAGSERR